MMDRAILGDNQFFAVNHLSDERSRAQAIRFKDNKAIIDVLDQAMECGVNTFMCTTHDRIAAICDHMRKNPAKYADFKFFPGMPYAHKYANALTELGILGTLQAYIPGNIFAVTGKAGLAYLRKDFPANVGTRPSPFPAAHAQPSLPSSPSLAAYRGGGVLT